MPDRFRRGEVYSVSLDPTEGHEQHGVRPCLIISNDRMNVLPIEMCIVLPITSRVRTGIPFHVTVPPPEGGLNVVSQVLCEQMRSVSHGRIGQYWGAMSAATITDIERILAMLLAL